MRMEDTTNKEKVDVPQQGDTSTHVAGSMPADEGEGEGEEVAAQAQEDLENQGSVAVKGADDAMEEEEAELQKPLLSSRRASLTRAQQLVTSKNVRNLSVWAMRLGVMADSVNTTILRPNYPFMVLPPSPLNPDSFPSTEPFEFSSAQFFLPMASLLGTAIAATVVGTLSDKIGRRPVMLVCVGFGVIGSIAKYFARNSFWGFCAASFVTGLFGATLAVSMAYASDIATTRKEKDGVIGSLVGISMVGATGGGLISIAMANVGLFEPLLVGAALNFCATVFAYVYLIEPNRMLHMGVVDAQDEDLDDATTMGETTTAGTDTNEADHRMNWRVTSNILMGSLLDNAGSTGFIPFCLTPLMINTFLLDFVQTGLAPIMSENAFRWISTMLAIMIIPAAASSASLYERIGAPAGCVLGNFLTGVFTIVLLVIATRADATSGSYAIYITIMYLGFPLTVLSQLSTGPMLDRVSPASKRGFTQGLNTTVMNLGQAIFPWLFGLMADGIGVETTIWVCVGVSFVAAVANSPLLFVAVLKPVPHVIRLPEYSRHMRGENKELIEQALRGEWVPPAALHVVNDQRFKEGHQFLVVPYKSYEDDKATKQICTIAKHSKEDFHFYIDLMTGYLNSGDLDTPESRAEVARQVAKSRVPVEVRNELAGDLGKWFSDYLLDAGYQVDDSPFVMKQMIMSAFPRIMKSSDQNEITPDNIEQTVLNFVRVYNHYMEEEENPAHIRAFAGAYT